MWIRGPLKDSKLILNESKLFPWSSSVNLVQFRTFRGPVTGQELFLAVSYSKLALKRRSMHLSGSRQAKMSDLHSSLDQKAFQSYWVSIFSKLSKDTSAPKKLDSFSFGLKIIREWICTYIQSLNSVGMYILGCL